MGAVLHVVPVRARPGRLEQVRAHLEPLVRGVEVHVIDLPDGPADLEHFVYEHAAVGEMLRILPGYVTEHGIGAVSVGCFYDPGMWELREVLEVPVVGVGEASFLLGSLVASRIAVLVGDRKWVPKMSENVRRVGMEHRICAWRSVQRSVQEMHDDPQGCMAVIRDQARAARDEDNAEAVILGCAALAGAADRLQQELGLPVIDPVAAAFTLACALASAGLRTSKVSGYRPKR